MNSPCDLPKEISKIHILGIGGTAMAGLAGLFREIGKEVRGSDSQAPYPPMGTLLAELGIPVSHPYSKANLDYKPDLAVIGNVIRKTNEEAMAVLEQGIPYMSMPEALRHFFLRGKTSVVVSGTHGKTTTTSLVAHLLAEHNQDPGFLVGGIPLNFCRNFRFGGGRFFVVEGDEYDTAFFDKTPKFWHYEPKAGIITNIEYDHADIYKDLGQIVGVFREFARLLPKGAPLVIPHGDKVVEEATKGSDAKIVTFGLNEGDFCAKDIRLDEAGSVFDLYVRGERYGTFRLPLLGLHNLKNCLAAVALVHQIIEPVRLREALLTFKGVKKRQEVIGSVKDIVVIDDFAHHPTAVRETIMAIRSHYNRRVIALFEPESNTSRRKVFQNEYVQAFRLADRVFFSKVLEKPDGLRPEEKLDLGKLCEDINALGVKAQVIENMDELAMEVAKEAMPHDIILAMSGRDFQGVHHKILANLEKIWDAKRDS
jgi:UDP-N-acetylmuramate: L-alanyl-gamma-D-glutamyl-meso-diaminopimelate ligase